jgi:hypothetical protein
MRMAKLGFFTEVLRRTHGSSESQAGAPETGVALGNQYIIVHQARTKLFAWIGEAAEAPRPYCPE